MRPFGDHLMARPCDRVDRKRDGGPSRLKFRDRLAVGRLTLDQVTLVRIQVPEPKLINKFMNYLAAHQWIFIIVVLWTLPWKGVALWKAARRSETGWFIAILILNTLAILEIIYIFYISKKADGSLPDQRSQTEKKVIDIKAGNQ